MHVLTVFAAPIISLQLALIVGVGVAVILTTLLICVLLICKCTRGKKATHIATDANKAYGMHQLHTGYQNNDSKGSENVYDYIESTSYDVVTKY